MTPKYNPAIKPKFISLAYAIVFLCIQQFIVASSTYFIAKLANSIAKNSLNQNSIDMWYLWGFIASLTLVYIPAYFATVFLQKSKFDWLNDYIDQFISTFYGKATLLNDEYLKNERAALVGQEVRQVIDDGLDYLFDSLALLLNISLNILVLSVVLDKLVLLSYVIGILSASVFIFFKFNIITKYAKLSQKLRVASLASIAKKSIKNKELPSAILLSIKK